MKPSFGKEYEPKPVPPEVRSLLDSAKSGDLETIRRLLEQGVPADATAKDYPDMPWNKTALMYAARHGHLDIVRTLLAAGASLSAVDENATDSESKHQPLHHAVTGGNLPVIEALLDAEADPNAFTSVGNPPLNFAIRGNNFPAASLLLARGAKIAMKLGRKRYTPPLVAAIEAEYPLAAQREWVKFLIDAGADPNATTLRKLVPLNRVAMGHDVEDPDRLAIINMLLDAGAEADLPDHEGGTALLTAVHFNNAEAAKLLVAAGANINAESVAGTLLDIAHQNLSNWQRNSSQPTDNEQLRIVWRIKLDNAAAMIALLEQHGAQRKPK